MAVALSPGYGGHAPHLYRALPPSHAQLYEGRADENNDHSGKPDTSVLDPEPTEDRNDDVDEDEVDEEDDENDEDGEDDEDEDADERELDPEDEELDPEDEDVDQAPPHEDPTPRAGEWYCCNGESNTWHYNTYATTGTEYPACTTCQHRFCGTSIAAPQDTRVHHLSLLTPLYCGVLATSTVRRVWGKKEKGKGETNEPRRNSTVEMIRQPTLQPPPRPSRRDRDHGHGMLRQPYLPAPGTWTMDGSGVRPHLTSPTGSSRARVSSFRDPG
ncbi:hypothetical protein GQ53DRAFT_772565 [Thozetella sp. PMI_491]|nr:hypothetical protein GQ53DRAFT_772565 [Thozetella sp. PMI_491]